MTELTARQALAPCQHASLLARTEVQELIRCPAPRRRAHGGAGCLGKAFSTLEALLVCSGLILALSGCVSSGIPGAIRTAPPRPLSVSQVQQAPDRFLGEPVRWGGTIIAVRNRAGTTEIEILSRPLSSDGEPRAEAPGNGRFIALLAGFADPAELPEKRLLTVAGHLARVERRPVGEYPYPYPVVAVEQRFLWPKPPPPRPPYFYPDPWYHPWYRPWHPWYRPWYY